MPSPRFLFPTASRAILVASVFATTACQPQADWEKDAEKAAGSASGKLQPPDIDTITVEKRADGLVYLSGKDKPYTGKDVETLVTGEKPEDRKEYVVVTPYTDGKIDGVKETYFMTGRLREARVYKAGEAIESTVYFPNGKKKLHAELNAKDVAEGAYQRWYDNGTLHTEGAHDAEERFQGEFKEYDEHGKLTGQYLWDHGVLKKIIFETPAQKKDREENYGKFESNL